MALPFHMLVDDALKEKAVELGIHDAILEMRRKKPRPGQIVAYRGCDRTHAFLYYEGTYAVVKAVDGELQRWPKNEIFDATRANFFSQRRLVTTLRDAGFPVESCTECGGVRGRTPLGILAPCLNCGKGGMQ
jgi:hypothetical protein